MAWCRPSKKSLSEPMMVRLPKHICVTRPQWVEVLNGFFLYLSQMITSMTGCVKFNDLRLWPISSRSFSYDLAIKLLKYYTSCCVCSAALKVLDVLFLYLAQILTSIRWYVVGNDLWPWPISSRLSSCEIANFMDYIHMWPEYNPGGDDVSCTISR